MLLIQDICLSWGKKERSSVYAEKRVNFPMAFPLAQEHQRVPDKCYGEVLVHRLDFWQRGNLFQTLRMEERYRIQSYASVQDLNMTNLSIEIEADGYEVTFFYDINRSGLPVRQGHNKDYHNVASPLYYHDILNETAFSLREGESGRILWNERKRDYDTGEWYYQLHVNNLLHCPEKVVKSDVFLTSSLTNTYEKLAELY